MLAARRGSRPDFVGWEFIPTYETLGSGRGWQFDLVTLLASAQRRQRQCRHGRRLYLFEAGMAQGGRLLAPMDQFHRALFVLDQRGAVFHPVTIIEIDHAVDGAYLA